jgi:flagellar motor switch protein FliN/FliY
MRHSTGGEPAGETNARFEGAERILTTRSPYHVDLAGIAADQQQGVVLPTLDKVSLDIAVVLGSTDMPVHQVLRLGRGAIIELDATEDDEVQILANNFPVAKGTVVVQGNRIAVEVKELLPRSPATR